MAGRSEEKARFERSIGYKRPQIRLARNVGMFAYELFPMHRHCKNLQMIVVIRAGRESRREYAQLDGHFAKHAGIKRKTNGGVLEWSNNEKVPSCNIGLLKGNEKFYSDVDTMSAWTHSGNKIDTNTINFQHEINFTLGREVMHGGNDDFYDEETGSFNGEPKHPIICLNDKFLIVGMAGEPFIIEGVVKLKGFYIERGFKSNLKFVTSKGFPVYMEAWPYKKF